MKKNLFMFYTYVIGTFLFYFAKVNGDQSLETNIRDSIEQTTQLGGGAGTCLGGTNLKEIKKK